MKKTKLIHVLSFISALLYSSWLVGYFINPELATNGTVSELSALSQPYREFFIATDIVMITTLMAASLLILLGATKAWQKVAILLYALFGVLTIVSTFIPLQCAQSIETCTSTTQTAGHMFAGTFAFVALLMALLIAFFYGRVRGLPYGISILFIWLCVAVVNTLVVLLGHSGPLVAITQRLFLSLTAVFIVLVPGILVSKSALSTKANRS